MRTKLFALFSFTMIASLWAAPDQATITQEVSVEILMDGHAMGATKLTAGQKLDFVSREGDSVILSMGGKTTVKVPAVMCEIPKPAATIPVPAKPESSSGVTSASGSVK